MATEANLHMLKDAGLIKEIPDSARANDLIVAVEATSEDKANGAIETLETLLLPEDVSTSSEVNIQDYARGGQSASGR